MKFSFGIVTSEENKKFLIDTINSIIFQNIEEYEIIVVGGSDDFLNNFESHKSLINHIEFDENIKDKWITRKKNLIIDNSCFENIVFLHDYVTLDQNWYKGFLEFGDNFQVCTNVINNYDKSRFRDWTLSPNNFLKIDDKLQIRMEYLLPYDEESLSKFMYISGAYWVAKKNIMNKYKLNENLTWGQGEDVEWSHRIRKKNKFKFNINSSVTFQKQKDIYFTQISKENLHLLKNRNLIFNFFDKIFIPVRRYKKKKKFFKLF